MKLKKEEFVLLGYYETPKGKDLVFYNYYGQFAKLFWQHNSHKKYSHFIINVYDNMNEFEDYMYPVTKTGGFFRYNKGRKPIIININEQKVERWFFVDYDFKIDYDFNNLLVCFNINSNNNLSAICDDFSLWKDSESSPLIPYLYKDVLDIVSGRISYM